VSRSWSSCMVSTSPRLPTDAPSLSVGRRTAASAP
jgi:hypothetical protein